MEGKLLEEVRDLIALHLDIPVDVLKDGADLTEEVGVDSIDYLDVITLLEMAYKVDIDLFEDTGGRLRTVAGLAEYIAAKKGSLI